MVNQPARQVFAFIILAVFPLLRDKTDAGRVQETAAPQLVYRIGFLARAPLRKLEARFESGSGLLLDSQGLGYWHVPIIMRIKHNGIFEIRADVHAKSQNDISVPVNPLGGYHDLVNAGVKIDNFAFDRKGLINCAHLSLLNKKPLIIFDERLSKLACGSCFGRRTRRGLEIIIFYYVSAQISYCRSLTTY